MNNIEINFYIFIFLLLSTFNANSNDTCRLEVSSTEESEVFLSKREIENLTRGDIIDAPISTYRINDQNIWILPTAMQRNSMVYLSHTLIKGDLSNPNQELIGIYNQYKFFTISDAAVSGTKGYKWITNTYQTKEGVLAFLHSEYTEKNDYWRMACEIRKFDKICAPGTSRIGLAWMDTSSGFDDNPSFKFLGHIAGSSAGRPHLNVHGTPYLITNNDGVDYLNILFRDANDRSGLGQITQARSPLNEVLAAAKNGYTTNWKKFNKGVWEDALLGQSSLVLPTIPSMANVDKYISDARVNVHSDVAKHKESGVYFLTAYTLKDEKLGTPSRLVFYDSCDGINWRFNRFSNDRDDGVWGWSYLTIVDDNGLDNGEVSGSFNLIAGFDYGRPKKHVMKLTVSVPDTCSCSSRD